MLAAAERLRRRADFTATVRGGQRGGRGSVVVHLIASTEPAHAEQSARAGFVVSRAVGNAVVRNRVRRRLRHLMRDRIGVLPSGACVVVRAQPQAAVRTYAEMAEDLDAALATVQRRLARQSGAAR